MKSLLIQNYETLLDEVEALCKPYVGRDAKRLGKKPRAPGGQSLPSRPLGSATV